MKKEELLTRGRLIQLRDGSEIIIDAEFLDATEQVVSIQENGRSIFHYREDLTCMIYGRVDLDIMSVSNVELDVVDNCFLAKNEIWNRSQLTNIVNVGLNDSTSVDEVKEWKGRQRILFKECKKTKKQFYCNFDSTYEIHHNGEVLIFTPHLVDAVFAYNRMN